jgi:hypothetical protein
VRALVRAYTTRAEDAERAAIRRAGLVAAAVYNVHRSKRQKPITPDDFVKPRVRILTPTAAAERFRAFAAAHNRRVTSTTEVVS